MSIEERLSKVEGRLQEQGDRFGEISGAVRQTDQKIDALRVSVDEKIDSLCTSIDDKVSSLNVNVDRKIDSMRLEMNGQFRWVIGLLLTFGIGILTAVLGVLTAVLKR